MKWAALRAPWSRVPGTRVDVAQAGTPARAGSNGGPQEWAVAITEALARHGNPRVTLSFNEAVSLVCDATGWPVGHVWVDSPTGWRSSGAWHNADDPARAAGYGALREATAITDLGSGRGIVAAVLHLESCRFLPGLEGLGSPLRRQHAAELGLRGVVGVPARLAIGGRRKVVAVLEFVTATEIEPDGALAQALLDVAERARRRVGRKAATASATRMKSLDTEILETPDHLAG